MQTRGFRPHLPRVGSRRPEGRNSGGESRFPRLHHRARAAGGRLLSALRHHSEQGAARTGACAIGACKAVQRHWRSSCAAMRRCRLCCTASMRSLPRRTSICWRSLTRNGVELIRGKGTFLDAHRIEVQHLDGSRRVAAVAARGARHRIEAASCAGHRSGSRAHCRQRLDFEPAVHSTLHAGAGQRRHRLRICLHLRRIGLHGDDAGQGRGAPGVSRPCAAQRISRGVSRHGRRVLRRFRSQRRTLRRVLAGRSSAARRRNR